MISLKNSSYSELADFKASKCVYGTEVVPGQCKMISFPVKNKRQSDIMGK